MLADELYPLLRAGFTGLWVETWEPHVAQQEINRACSRNDSYSPVQWDCSGGLLYPKTGQREEKPDPRHPLTRLWDGPTVVCLHNFHKFLDNPVVMQAFCNAVLKGRLLEDNPHHYVVVSSVLKLPVEVEKLVTVVRHPLPTPQELHKVLEGIKVSGEMAVEDGAVDAARGLTSLEAENAFALSLNKYGRVARNVVLDQKTQAVRKKGFLELHQGSESFSDIGGLAGAKQFCTRLLNSRNAVRPKGVLLVGVPGTGKSLLARSLGNEVGRPTLMMDVGRLHSKYVGDSEANLRGALDLADSLSPCVLFIDEVEKALSGVGSDGDSGVATRIFGSLLTWMSDHKSDVFVTLSANDVSKLPTEFTRQGRMDRVFMVDLPDERDRENIWKIHTQRYRLPEQPLPDSSSWTGAEIEACCRLSAALECPLAEAAEGIVPVSVSASESVARLRTWAKDRVIDAATGRVYSGVDARRVKTGTRKVHTEGN